MNITDFNVWDKAASSAEITEAYNSGKVLDVTTHSAYANITNTYRIGEGDTFPNILDGKGTVDGIMTNMTVGVFESDVP